MNTYILREIKLLPGSGDKELRAAAASRLGVSESEIAGVETVRRSVDARKKEDIRVVYSAAVTLAKKLKNAELYERPRYELPTESRLSRRPLVVGAGPAGLMAAYTLAHAGARPILIERGLPVEERAKKAETFFASGELDTECNVQFGEGGAGAFSDGKLTTGIKNERIGKVLEIFVENGAPAEIAYEAKPHVGTDRLPAMVASIRRRIIEMGGEVIFSAKLTDLDISGGAVKGAKCLVSGREEYFETDRVILAVGHSARDVFEMLLAKGVAMKAKPFSVGVRAEHLQSEINKAMYGAQWDNPYLGAADYKLAAHLPDGRGVYTFCMCPGGFVVAAASEEGGVVTNGMSAYARDGANANSALLVGVDERDCGEGPLAGVRFQRELERCAFAAGGGGYRAPAFRMDELLSGAAFGGFGSVAPTYRPGVSHCPPEEFLPRFVYASIAEGVKRFAAKIKGFDCPDAVLTGAETRSSSPVRVLRGENMQSLNVAGLYPCGEGAGYAGGIMSSAVDGIAVAERVLEG